MRPLEQLNQTLTLIKKVEDAVQVNEKKLEQFGVDKSYVEDTKDDKKHLIQFKNLPSIRDKLLSIKSKQ